MSLKDAGGRGSHEKAAYHLHIYPQLSGESHGSCIVNATKESIASDVIKDVTDRLNLDVTKHYLLAEVKESGGEEWVLDANDSPVQRVLLWPRRAQEDHSQKDGYYFLLQERNSDGSIKYVYTGQVSMEKEARQMVERGFLPRRQEDYDDLCNLPQLTETSILQNLKTRFMKHKIYTYAGSILIAINPFKFLPIYNPKYVKLYDNHQLGKLEPHIFAIADVAYHTMLKKHINQCIVISGESGSGKTQSTNFLIHCLTALSQKGYASGVERTILGAGPVLEAFGNAKTAHNNNSSRFGKFIQVNYLENGIVRGAVVEKYLLEKSRLVSQEKDERNYHVFYYLLLGVTEEERREFQLKQPEDYFYLNQNNFKIDDGEDLRHDFERLKQAMEMVGFLPPTKKQIFSVLSAILYLGNVTYKRKSNGRDEGLEVGPPEVLDTLSQLLQVKREMLVEALTKRKTVTVNEKLILPYSLNEAITARDSMAKSLYSALFDWIVLRINHALLNKKDMEESVTCLSIGVLDIFGFEDFETNSFEQFCINYANEQLQYYFNQHIFKLEQEEYQKEGISWHNIDYTDNVGCIHLISKKPTGLFYLLDEESNFPHATYQTLLAKFKQQHEDNKYFVGTPVMEPAFIIRHFAGKVKYQIKDFREKNTDYMRPDIVALLRSSDSAYIRELIGMDPVSVFRWAILRAAIRAMAVFNEAGRQRAQKTAGVVRKGTRIPLGELQRANVPVEKVYRLSLLDFALDSSEEFDIDAFEDIITSYESRKDMHAQMVKSIKGLPWQGEDPGELLRTLSRLQHSRAQHLKTKGAKGKQTIPKNLLDSKSLKLIVSMTLHDRTTKSLLHLNKKKKPPSISAQFQTSLNKLLETLGKAEPFFIRCIRSNAEKMELYFDEALVLQQLRYTGMLETVRIRRSGYSAKYTFQDFMDQFKVLLPKNAKPGRDTISALLFKMGMDRFNHQIGKSKVFMKEPERQKLQDTLHKEVIRKIVLLQSWFRMVVARRHYLRMRQAAITIQRCWRSYIDWRIKHNAAAYIQAIWRGYKQLKKYQEQRTRIQLLQARCRGHLLRKRFQQMVQEKKTKMQEAEKKEKELQAKKREEELKQAALKSKNVIPKEEQLKSDVSKASEVSTRKEEPPQVGEISHGHISEKPVLLNLKSTPDGLDKPASSREKREYRRQRGLEHDKLQNKNFSISEDEPSSPCGTEQNGVLEKEIDVFKEPNKNLKEEFNKVSVKDTVSETKVMLDKDNAKEITGGEKTHRKNVSDSKVELADKVSNSIGQQVHPKQMDKQDGNHTSRPVSLPLNVNNNFAPIIDDTKKTLEIPVPKTKTDPSKMVTKAPDSPPGVPPQRYTDPHMLKKKAEKWKGKRQMETEPNEVGKEMDSEKLESLSPAGKTPEKKTAASQLEDVSAVPNVPPVIQQSPGVTDSPKKVPVHKKKSDEGASHDADGKHRGPFYRLLGKKPEKKSSKDCPQTPDGKETVSFPHTVSEAPGTKKESEVSGHSNRNQPGDHSGKEANARVKRNPSIKISKATTVSEKWNASAQRQITNSNELVHLDEFLFNKINDLNSQKSGIECLFFEATEKFRGAIRAIYTTPNPQIHTGYRDLMAHYQLLVDNLAKEREEKDVKLVLNLFQSILDEFTRGYTRKEVLEPQKSKAQKKKRKQDQVTEHSGHVLIHYQASIGQSCEQCSSNIWPMDKVYLCNTCKMICHKKCMSKIQNVCVASYVRKNEQNSESRHFGVRVSAQTSDSSTVPIVMEKLLEYLEMHGLYTEGIYRKSGAANRMRELKQSLENDPSSVKLENYPIHTITGILKQWLRELPEPLMTFSQYNDFLRAVELPGKQEQLCALYKVVEQLPQVNHNTLERLIFHLVQVASLEDVNRMSPNSLAIVFAPCLLRCPDNSDPLTSMKDVSKTTTCIEMLIKEQIRKYKIRVDEISQLEAAETMAIRRLSLLRQNTSRSPKSNDSGIPALGSVQEEEPSEVEVDRESEILIDRIQSIKEEKEDITYRLPELDQRGSDEENLDSEASISTESLLEDRTGQLDREEPPKISIQSCHSEFSTSSTGGVPARDTLTVPSISLAWVQSDASTVGSPLQRRPSSFLAKMKVHRRNPVIPASNIKLPYGIVRSTESLGKATGASAAQLVARRRDQPARRKDSVHSVYIAHGTEHGPVDGPFEDYEPTAKLKRRFSDPFLHVPCVEESNL
ncbi:unconventional myosin-IXb isoform X3 [Ambystoma mexicanum]|uniref:unconventional myosin-IXb isoform X3 n=1 Tax=Ambystoma mexicanum TaxID=8296 RepID=UPI0037E7F2DE